MTDQQKVLLIVAIAGLYVFLRARWVKRKWMIAQTRLAERDRTPDE
ncbi:hypothetical protein [Sphingomonas sp.]|nr:hypothetical protein [Sphingomonas sp.]HTG39697.1 hypothetical protein [Sphingomonas sp.]